MTDRRGPTQEAGVNEAKLESVMKQIREAVQRRRHSGNETDDDLPSIETLAMDEPQTIVSFLLSSGIQTAAKAHDTLAAGISSFSRTRLRSWIAPYLVRGVRFFAHRQVQWNAVVADVLGMFLNAMDRIEARFIEVHRRLEDTSKRLGRLEQESDRVSSVQAPQRRGEERRETSEMLQRIISMEGRCHDMQARLTEAERKQEETARQLELLAEASRATHLRTSAVEGIEVNR